MCRWFDPILKRQFRGIRLVVGRLLCKQFTGVRISYSPPTSHRNAISGHSSAGSSSGLLIRRSLVQTQLPRPIFCSVRLAARSLPFQGKETGSIPVQSANSGGVELDILPALKSGDPYCDYAQARNSLRWVPAAGGLIAPLTSQANWACPALKTLIAPTTSACSLKPHLTQKNTDWV